MMLMHAIHGNGTLIVKANNNTAEVSSGIYSVNGQERIRKSTIGYKNQNRIHRQMMGLMQKYGVYEYEGNIYRLKGMDHWESEAISKVKKNVSLLKPVRWG